jgi:hypothetical protein
VQPDPQGPQPETFAFVVDKFVTLYAQPRQRTWQQTEAVLTENCAPLMQKRMANITKRDCFDLLDGFIADGHVYKAPVTRSWLRTLFKWAAKRDYITAR